MSSQHKFTDALQRILKKYFLDKMLQTLDFKLIKPHKTRIYMMLRKSAYKKKNKQTKYKLAALLENAPEP
jgi:hypothetical protein